MRIKFTTSIAGPSYTYKPGDEADWPNEAEAERFIAAGYAVRIGPPPTGERKPERKPERADGKAGGEKATLKR